MSVRRRNFVQTFASGSRALLFAHGFGCDQTMGRYVTPRFRDHFRVVLFDHVGSGRSDLSTYDFAKYDSLHGYASDLLDISRELSAPQETIAAIATFLRHDCP